ncbi:hypothetical protein [Paenibacillus alvei]|uniref:hypothetical protein n=1 Tax=Paenibacillus alvei TaxID=44250 RepID=UPI001F1616E6|nr:hypothetical protein [Paenibacillus alvei]
MRTIEINNYILNHYILLRYSGRFQLLLEVYCLYGIEDDKEYGDIPPFCKSGAEQPGYCCMENSCPFVAYTDAPFEIAYAGESGGVPNADSWIGFGGDMEPDDADEGRITDLKKLWEDI